MIVFPGNISSRADVLNAQLLLEADLVLSVMKSDLGIDLHNPIPANEKTVEAINSRRFLPLHGGCLSIICIITT